MKAIFLMTALALALFNTSSTYGSEFSPATFKSGDSAFSSRIKFPSSFPDGTQVFECTGIANYLGGLSAVSCKISAERKRHEKKAIRAIQKASRGVRLFPATIDGAGKKVWFTFSVAFTKRGEHKEITTSENHLLDADKYGEAYTSAQRLIKPTTKMCAKGILMSTNINDDGNPSNAAIVSSLQSEPKSCTDRMLKLMLESEYIPAIHNHKPIEAIYHEAFTDKKKLHL